MYEARKVCNYLLAHYDAKQFDLTNLRLNKLIYFIHAESLLMLPQGLIRNRFEAWQFGPVIRPVFDAFKIYDEKPVTRPAFYLDYASGQQKPIPSDDIAPDHTALIERTFERYKGFTTGQLVSLSHEPGGPWDVVYRAHLADNTVSPIIPNDLIRRHLSGELKTTVRH